MLSLLLDEHIGVAVAEGLRRAFPMQEVFAMPEWEGGAYLGKPDPVILETAAHQKLTLVTYDKRTIRPFLKKLAEQTESHGGVIFVDAKTISLGDVGAMVRALSALIVRFGATDWKDIELFLGP